MSNTDFTSLNNIGILNITIYFSLCVLLFIVCFGVNNNFKFKIYFFITTFFIQLGINIYVMTNLNCPNGLMLAMLNTLFPWLFILLLGIMLIDNIPGWLRIFSNTTGMFIALNWWKDLLEDLKSNPSNKDSLLSEILFKPQTILNEIDIVGLSTLEQHELYTKILTGIHPNLFTNSTTDPTDLNTTNKTFKDDTKEESEPIQMTNREYKILSILNLKNNIGYFIWYSLIGLIASIVSVNSSINTNCN
jgi:hypothetical protein